MLAIRLGQHGRWAVDCGGDLRVSGDLRRSRSRTRSPADDRDAQAQRRRRRHVRHRPAAVARARRLTAPSPARSRHGAARVDRDHPGDRARADRAGGRHARQGRAALRPGRTRAAGSSATAGSPSTTTGRRLPRPADPARLGSRHDQRTRVLADQPLGGRRRARARRRLGPDRADARRRPRRPAATTPGARRVPRADRARRPDRDRRPRRCPARRRLPQARAHRHHDPVRHRLPAGLRRPGDHRRLPRGVPRPLASTPASGSAASAGASCIARRRSSTCSA